MFCGSSGIEGFDDGIVYLGTEKVLWINWINFALFMNYSGVLCVR